VASPTDTAELLAFEHGYTNGFLSGAVSQAGGVTIEVDDEFLMALSMKGQSLFMDRFNPTEGTL
jgi:hypothetical protein